MIYCVWYPTGGFGHFINGILSLYGKNFARPHDQTLTFAQDGNAHKMPLVAPKYFHEPESYHFDFDPTVNYSVLIDNGIHNEGERFKTFFPDAKIIRICYLNSSWPIIARTIIHKVLKTSIEQELAPGPDLWPGEHDWARREKYFLYLRDHWLQPLWRPNTVSVPEQVDLAIDDLLDYTTLRNKLINFGICLEDFSSTWNEWRTVNSIFIDPVKTAHDVVDDVKRDVHKQLDHVTDLWTQAVIYYFLWTEFGREVPHNDYADFFNSTSQIRQWLAK